MLAHVPSFGRNPRGSPDFLAYPVPKACMHVLGTRVPRRLGVARSASSPKAAQALGCSLTPGLRISFGRVTCMARAASVPRLWALGFLLLCGVCVWVRLAVGCRFCYPASPGWGLGWVCLGTVCGVVPLVSAVCGVRGWASVSACFWDVCGFVGAPLAPRRFWFRRAVWACVLGPGLGCAQPFLAGLSGCVFCAFVFPFFFFSVPDFVVPFPPSPFFRAGLVALFFFFFWCPLSLWAAVTGLVLPVLGGWSPCASVGVLSSVPSGGGGLAACGGVGGRFGGCGLYSCLFPLPPPFFISFGGGACLFLPLPSLGWRTHWPAFSVVFRAAVFSCVLCGRVPAPWVGWAMYTVGSARLLAGLGPGSAGWAAAPGGCLWFWVRGLGLFVSFPLCGAGCNLLGGPPPLSPGALWPRVWPSMLVCGVLARRLLGCAVAGFG